MCVCLKEIFIMGLLQFICSYILIEHFTEKIIDSYPGVGNNIQRILTLCTVSSTGSFLQKELWLCITTRILSCFSSLTFFLIYLV